MGHVAHLVGGVHKKSAVAGFGNLHQIAGLAVDDVLVHVPGILHTELRAPGGVFPHGGQQFGLGDIGGDHFRIPLHVGHQNKTRGFRDQAESPHKTG